MNISEGTVRHTFALYQATPHLDFTAVAYTQSIFLLGVPANTLIVGVMARLVTQFVAFGMSLCTVSIGAVSHPTTSTTDRTTENFYMPVMSCTQVPSSTSFMYWSPIAMYTTYPQDIRANFTSTGAFLSTITAGEVEITIMYRSL